MDEESVCYVTAFYDIKRSEWDNTFRRNISTYLSNFYRFARLFENERVHQLYVFLDEHIELDNIVRQYPNVFIVSINKTYMESLHCWKTLDREREIMSSPAYKGLVGARGRFPEHCIPEYTLINHSKIDFIEKAMESSTSKFFAWVDFGYCY